MARLNQLHVLAREVALATPVVVPIKPDLALQAREWKVGPDGVTPVRRDGADTAERVKF